MGQVPLGYRTSDHGPSPGNGAREALLALVSENDCAVAATPLEATDYILADLWRRGFKIVPLEMTETDWLDKYTLPCDVLLPPNTIICKGCSIKTLITGLSARETIFGEAPSQFSANGDRSEPPQPQAKP